MDRAPQPATSDLGPARRLESPDVRRLVEVAMRYGQHGWPVLPLHTPTGRGCSCSAYECGSPGKHPRNARGLHEASTDDARIRGWWARWPHANVGVATGTASGLVVLDIDVPDGPDSLAELEARHGPLPATCEQRTGSGGRQLLFAHPGTPVRNRAGVVPGIDVRGDGGYIVVPPSLHAVGHRYQWTGRTPPARAPGWLLALLDRSRGSEHRPPREVRPTALPAGGRARRYAAAAMHDELSRLAAAVEGARNATLNRAAFSLGQLVAVGLLDHDHVAAELERVATGLGLGEREIQRTVASGLGAGLDQPRAVPELAVARAAAPPPAASLPAPVRRIGARRR
jgi:hypothetical protein